MRTRARTDRNHTAIIRVIRQCGCSVLDLSAVGSGCPDLLIGISGRNVLIEIKDGQKPASQRKLTPRQVEFHAEWRGGKVFVVNNISEAVGVINEMRTL